MNKKSLIGLAVAAALVLIVAGLLYVREVEAQPGGEGDIRDPEDRGTATDDVRAHVVAKLDTRFQYRYQYHVTIYNLLRNTYGLSPISAKLFTAHASKATRGWRDSKYSTPDIEESPGKLWNWNCFGVKAGPKWQSEHDFYIAGTHEYSESRGYYPTVSSWRSYRDISEAIENFIRIMGGAKYRPAYEYVKGLTSMDEIKVTKYARLLADPPAGGAGYFTADPYHWGSSVWNIYRNIAGPDIERHA